MTLNLATYNDYVFNATSSGVQVYSTTGVSGTLLGFIPNDYTSCIGLSDGYLYVGTTSSGIYSYDMGLIGSGIYDVYSVYKQYPDVTNDTINYMHCNGYSMVVSTDSGIDYFNTDTGTHYYCNDDLEFGSCFTSSGTSIYYATKDMGESFYGYGNYIYTLSLTSSTAVTNYQVLVTLTVDTFDYTKVNVDGSNIVFYDIDKNLLPFYIEDWDYDGTSTIWVKIPYIGTYNIYLVIVDADLNYSSPTDTFMLYDDFTTSGILWDTSNLISFGYLLSSGTVDIPCVVEQKINSAYAPPDTAFYGVFLELYTDGVSFSYDNKYTTFDVTFTGNTVSYYNPTNGVPNPTDGILSVTFDYGIIKYSFKDSSYDLKDSWLGPTHNGSGRPLKLVTASSLSTVSLDWVRVRKYSNDNTRILTMEETPELLVKTNSLNYVYDVNSNWLSNNVNYFYNYNKGIEINEIVATENTSVFNSDNVIFVALTDGIHVIEENRGNEHLNRMKYYRTT